MGDSIVHFIIKSYFHDTGWTNDFYQKVKGDYVKICIYEEKDIEEEEN